MGLNLIVMGPPGAGKGTQAAQFAQARGLPKISTGDILREAVRVGDPIAVEARTRMDAGELVDDAKMIHIVRERLSRPDTRDGFVLDGFPRTVDQARALDEIMLERGNGPLIVVDVMVPREELVRRLASRLVCSVCATNAHPFGPVTACERCGGGLVQRTDDNQGVVLERLNVYRRATAPVLGFYRDRPTFREVNGAQAPELVAKELDALVDAAFAAIAR